MRLKFFVSAALIALMVSPAFAQSRKDLAAQDAAMAERLTRLEQRMLTGDPAAERLMQRIDTLETAQRTLRGEVERLRFERDNLKGEVEALSGDVRAMQALSNRMQIHLDAVDLVAKEQRDAQLTRRQAGVSVSQNRPSAPISSVPSAPVFKEQTYTAPSAQPSNDVTQLGQIGKTKLAEGDFSGAQSALQQYLQFNPNASDASEMQFWLGETYYVRGGYADAADAYIAAMRKSPQGVKSPDAMVRLAAALRGLGQNSESCATLASFPAQYPNAPQSLKDKARSEAALTGC